MQMAPALLQPIGDQMIPAPPEATPVVDAVDAPAVGAAASSALGPAEPMPLEGERRLATVVVADVSRSTELLERMGTEAWVETMNRVLQTLEREIYRLGGVVDQFRGDGLVAFFGATAAHEDDPEDRKSVV